LRVADIGYRTKLFLAFVLTYMLGVALMTVTRNINDFVLGLIWKPSKALPWDNPSWRRAAAIYLGSDLMPLNPESTESEWAYLAALGGSPGGLKELVTYRESTKGLEETLSKLEASISRLRETNAEKAKELVDPMSDQITQAATMLRESKKND
jgi:hypothetical protein